MDRFKLFNQPIKYVIIGFMTIGLDYTLFLLILKLTGNYLIAENLKLPVTLSFNYFAHRIFTFKSSKTKRTEIPLYILSNVLVWFIANGILILLVWLVGNPALAKTLQIFIMPIITYIIFKYLVFRK